MLDDISITMDSIPTIQDFIKIGLDYHKIFVFLMEILSKQF